MKIELAYRLSEEAIFDHQSPVLSLMNEGIAILLASTQ